MKPPPPAKMDHSAQFIVKFNKYLNKMTSQRYIRTTYCIGWKSTCQINSEVQTPREITRTPWLTQKLAIGSSVIMIFPFHQNTWKLETLSQWNKKEDTRGHCLWGKCRGCPGTFKMLKKFWFWIRLRLVDRANLQEQN